MIDYYVEAVRIWQESNHRLKRFAECCANVDGKRTAALASDCGVSVDTIENYRNAYKLYYSMCESEPVRKAWKTANAALWVKAAQLKDRLGLTNEKVIEYLIIAKESNMSRETFSAHVVTKEDKTPQWLRRLRWVASKLRPSKDDWKTEMPFEKQERYNKAVEWFTDELKAIAEVTE